MFAQSVIFPHLQRHKIKSDYTDEEQQRFNDAKKCYFCDKDFDKFSEKEEEEELDDEMRLKFEKVRDHCHYTNKYLGAAHNRCNLNRYVRRRLNVFVHNLKNYDSHFLLKIIDLVGLSWC